jgi:hypothetical protein
MDAENAGKLAEAVTKFLLYTAAAAVGLYYTFRKTKH